MQQTKSFNIQVTTKAAAFSVIASVARLLRCCAAPCRALRRLGDPRDCGRRMRALSSPPLGAWAVGAAPPPPPPPPRKPDLPHLHQPTTAGESIPIIPYNKIYCILHPHTRTLTLTLTQLYPLPHLNHPTAAGAPLPTLLYTVSFHPPPHQSPNSTIHVP